MDNFSVRWTGQLEAPVTGRYTLKPIADDSMRLYLDGRLIADIKAAKNQTASASVQVDLIGGQRYPLTIEYVELDKTAIAALQWSYPGISQEVIPTSRLYAPNQAPTVALTSPATGARLTVPTSVNLAATASDLDGSVSNVEFFSGTTKVGEATAAPYALSLANVAPGSYSFTARATDNQGATTTSAPVTVDVVKPTFADATAASPSAVDTGAATSITAKITCNSAGLTNGNVDLEVYNSSGARVAQQTWSGQDWAVGEQRSYSYAWTAPSTEGAYTVKVGVFNGDWNTVYYWNDSAATITATKPVPVNVPPTVSLNSPSADTGYTAPATVEISANAADSDGSVAKVEFFAGASKLGEDTTAPYGLSWGNVQAGTYSITAKATDNSGASATSAPVSVTVSPAVTPVPVAGLGVPANLRIKGLWQAATNAPTDVLTWDPVPGADSYNVYQYDVLIAKGLKTPSFTVPTNVYYAYLTYDVTAVAADGSESIPSNIALAQGAFNPNVPPPYYAVAPVTPAEVKAFTDWNLGRPRVRLTWINYPNAQFQGPNETYNVYRDGVRIATGLWGLTYLDLQVNPGETHTYQVVGANVNWLTPQESPLSLPVTITAAMQAPAPLSTPVTITGVTPNDDSVVVSFSAVPGAVDYRCYQAGNPSNRKYSGGGLRIEMNGLNPATGADLIVEAVDKFGPFQKHDGFAGPGTMQHDGTMLMEVNGQGDPSNVPNVLATSPKFHVTCTPRALSGSQAFFDTFRNSQPFVWAEPPASLLPNANNLVSALQNDKWMLYNVQGDLDNSRFFVQGNHFMDTFYDGDRPGGRGPLHNNVASFLMTPRQTADISGGRVLHVTFEVDPHMGPRRWCDLFVADANDPLVVPGKFLEFNQLPTVSGNLFRWELLNNIHGLQLFKGVNGQLQMTDLIDDPWGIARRSDFTNKGTWNGSTQDIDLRHRYDLYLSQNHVRILENGTVIKDGDFPAGTTLPFSNVSVYFVHQVYHTGVERPDLTLFYTNEAYWYNHRPYGDERHWDNMGFEVLSAFPAIGVPTP